MLGELVVTARVGNGMAAYGTGGRSKGLARYLFQAKILGMIVVIGAARSPGMWIFGLMGDGKWEGSPFGILGYVYQFHVELR